MTTDNKTTGPSSVGEAVSFPRCGKCLHELHDEFCEDMGRAFLLWGNGLTLAGFSVADIARNWQNFNPVDSLINP